MSNLQNDCRSFRYYEDYSAQFPRNYLSLKYKLNKTVNILLLFMSYLWILLKYNLS